MRFKITRNIGHCYVRLGEYQNAINSYETILKGTPDHITAFNLIICLYAAGDKLRMKDCFTSMITNPVEEEEEEPKEDGVVSYDRLKEEQKSKRKEEIRVIVTSAKLVAPIIENDIIEAFDWIL